MLRVFAGLSLLSSAVAVAQTAPPAPATPPPVAPAPEPVAPTMTPPVAPEATEAPEAVEAPEAAEAPEAEAPKMKKVCHAEDVVGSAIPRQICKMKPIKPPKSAN